MTTREELLKLAKEAGFDIHPRKKTIRHPDDPTCAALNTQLERFAALLLAQAQPNVNEMVNKFLGWKLPKDFGPDAGISFKPTYPERSDWWPAGTNLLTADQAKQMFLHCLSPCTNLSQPQDQWNAAIEAAARKCEESDDQLMAEFHSGRIRALAKPS